MGLQHFRKACADRAAEDCDKFAHKRDPRGFSAFFAACQREYDKVDRRNLKHLQYGIQKADRHGFVYVLSLISGETPDFAECFDHSASPSFAPICACHISR